jgi:hypothetical protein
MNAGVSLSARDAAPLHTGFAKFVLIGYSGLFVRATGLHSRQTILPQNRRAESATWLNTAKECS